MAQHTFQSHFDRSYKLGIKQFLLLLLIFLLMAFFNFFIVLKPSNNRNWEVGMDKLPEFNIQNNLVTIANIRDFRFDENGPISKNYLTQSYDAGKITKVWFVQEPFTIQPFGFFHGVAHTYFVFDFQNQDPLVVSVEARREKGETYDAFKGLFNQFELIYIWGTEKDETIERVVNQHNALYMYPLQISVDSAQKLFLQMAQTSKSLETTPRFYNTLSSNCTNELAKAANEVKPGTIPFNRALFFPGYSDLELYKLGFIPHSLPVEQERQRYYISDLVQKYSQDIDFSSKLRTNLPQD